MAIRYEVLSHAGKGSGGKKEKEKSASRLLRQGKEEKASAVWPAGTEKHLFARRKIASDLLPREGMSNISSIPKKKKKKGTERLFRR